MTASDIVSIIEALGKANASSFKCGDMELHFNKPVVEKLTKRAVQEPPHQPKQAPLQPNVDQMPLNLNEVPDAMPSQDPPIPDSVVQLKSILGMGDMDLLDRIFPLPKAEEITDFTEESSN